LRPEDYETPGFLAQAYAALGRTDESMAARRKAMKIVDQHLELNPDDARALILGAVNSANLHDTDRAMSFAERAMTADPEDPMLLYNVACTYSQLQQTDEALGALERAAEKGWGDRAWIEHDSDWDRMRDNSRFRAIVESM
jgi:tetratricopeptide (TPR) repeat protein